MSGVLIAVYSLDGNARTLADALARKLDAHIVEITESRPRRGGLERPSLRSRLDALFLRRPPIAENAIDVGHYDLVLLAAPMIAGRVAAPMRSFVHRCADALDDWALLVTHDAAKVGPSIANEFTRRIGRAPRVVLDMTRDEVDAPSVEMKLDIFAKTLASA